ncbi:MAG: hypothetical protein KIS66_16410 [Fimbriimonadaceae bacterium]|nr:hypothetical protein [Fimbriimonadaceae bacterium]
MSMMRAWLGRWLHSIPGGLLSALILAGSSQHGAALGVDEREITVSLEIDRSPIQVGEALTGRIILDVKGVSLFRNDHRVGVYVCEGRNIAPKVPYGTVLDEMDAGRREDALAKLSFASLPGRVWRQFYVPVKQDGRIVVPLDQAGPVYPLEFGSSRLVSSGDVCVAVLAVFDDDDRLDPRDYDDAMVTVRPLVPKLVIRSVEVDPTTPPRPLAPFVVEAKFELEGLPNDPKRAVRVRRAVSVKERKPLKDRPYQNSRAETIEVAGSGDGRSQFVKRWRVTLPRAGAYEFEIEVACPGFRNASKRLAVTLPARTAPTPPKPPPSVRKTPEWLLDHTLVDPDRLEGKALYAGTITGVSAAGFTANYDQVFKVSNGFGPNSLMKISVAGSPPPRLKQGDRFQMTVSATASKVGMDKCIDGREPNQQAGGNIGATPHIKVTATPHASGIVFPDGHDGTTVCVGGYFGKWWSADSRTYTLEVVAADSAGDLTIGMYFPGFGTFARYVYVRAKEPKPTSTLPSSTATKATPGIVPEDEATPLTVLLEPSEVEVSPRQAVSTLVTLLIKGDRPNWKPVEVLIDTVDAWGTLRANRFLKIEGKGSRQTGDMWKTNDGYFHWNLNVLANLGVAGGTYLVPITVRQVGHGQVVLWLTIRVPMDARRPAPRVSSTSLATLFETATLSLRAGGTAVRNRLYVSGFAEGDEPVTLTFPEARLGGFPGGLRVLPGDTMLNSVDAEKVTRDGLTWLVFDLTFSADAGATVGTRTVRAIVRQGGREAPAILVVRIEP